MSSYTRGHVIWATDPFGRNERPWIILSDDTHPFHGEEYSAIAVSTTDRSIAVPLPADAWISGSPPRMSYANPWSIIQIQDDDITEFQGTLTESITDNIREAAIHYLA